MNISFINIYKAFLKIGAILLGGGYVIIPIMQEELVKKRNWLTQEEVCDYYCVSQCLPGIIAVNISILVGYKLKKTTGMMASILGIATSPIITILLIVPLVDNIIKIPCINNIFWGVNISVIILIYLALREMWQKSIVDIFSVFWFILILVLSIFKVSPMYLILASIFLGIIIYLLRGKKHV